MKIKHILNEQLIKNTGTYSADLIPQVKKIQTLLQRLGYDVGTTGIDGKYGPRTEKAVRRFQQDNSLKVDGIVGSETLAALSASKSRSPRGQLTNVQTQRQGGTQTGRQSSTANSVKAPQLSGTAMDMAATLIKGFEGYYEKAYWDYKQWTIGYGSKAKSQNEVINRNEAERRLRAEMQSAYQNVAAIQKRGNYNWSPKQIAALTSFAYNIGSINQLTANGTRDDATILAKIPLYRKAGGKVLKGLVNRRNQEAALFKSGMTDAA